MAEGWGKEFPQAPSFFRAFLVVPVPMGEAGEFSTMAGAGNAGFQALSGR